MKQLAARAAVLVSLVVALLGATAATAEAHATLESTSPGAGVVLAQPPRVVTATFDESVGVSDDSLRVFAPDGSQVDTSATTTGDSPSQVRTTVLSTLTDGTYTVAWHVISADSHPVSGAFTFSVGHPSGHVSAQSVETSGSRAVSVLYAVTRGLAYLGYSMFAGGLLFLGWCWPAGTGLRRSRLVLAGGWVITAGATAAGFVLQGVYAAGRGPGHLLDGGLLHQTLTARVGEADLARLALLVVSLPIVLAPVRSVSGPRAPVRLVASVALAVLLAVTWPIADHASVGRLVALTVAVETVHLVAMAAWLGGLSLLLVAVLRPAPPLPTSSDTAVAAVHRFSHVAGWCVLLLILTGTYQSWRNVGHWAALVHTTYGVLILAKIAGILLLIGLGALARARLRSDEHPDLAALRRSVGAEVVVVLVVLGVTAVLVETATAGESYHPVTSTSRPFDTGGRSGVLALTVEPAQAGPQTVRLDLRDTAGRPYTPAQLTATLTLATEQLGPLVVTLHRTAGGDYVSDPVPLDVRGTWTLAVTVRSSAFDETTVEVPVPIS